MNINKMVLCVGLSLLCQVVVGMDEPVNANLEIIADTTWRGEHNQKLTGKLALTLREKVLQYDSDVDRSHLKTIFTASEQEDLVNFATVEYDKEGKHKIRTRAYGVVATLDALELLKQHMNDQKSEKEMVLDFHPHGEEKSFANLQMTTKVCMAAILAAKKENLDNLITQTMTAFRTARDNNQDPNSTIQKKSDNLLDKKASVSSDFFSYINRYTVLGTSIIAFLAYICCKHYKS